VRAQQAKVDFNEAIKFVNKIKARFTEVHALAVLLAPGLAVTRTLAMDEWPRNLAKPKLSSGTGGGALAGA
jgi:hypothetical protein